jgi:hypothetical protein
MNPLSHKGRIVIIDDDIDVVVLDMNFSPGETSGREGLEWLKKITEVAPDVYV